MKYEEICKTLLSEFTDIKKWEDDSKLSEREKMRPYYMAICLIYYLTEKFEKNDLETVKKGFSFIEKMLMSGDNKTKKLVKTGFLPSIHIINNYYEYTDDKFLEFMGIETKSAYDKFKTRDIKNYYPNVAVNPAIASVDVSHICDVRVIGNDLFLGIDCIYYFRNNKGTTMENDGVDTCYLVIKDYELISERPIGEYTKEKYYQKNVHRALKHAKKQGESLYTSFENFIHNNGIIEVQTFEYDYEKNTICIHGYGNSQTNSEWVGLTFQFSNLYLYWNDEILSHDYNENATYKNKNQNS
jgi:hypothetical protein